ncbi:MAG TPA: MBL fold metallo-hydrolase [Jatrophihabitantaceae bacterium]|nr:MBL fold metallo-hydrolase [Jatrophihabitantaceae bacterium]
MRLTVLGGCGAWPAAGAACSGYLVESAGFRLLVDPGYATLPRLLEHIDATAVDAVLVSHGHPDHCADLNPLLRARVFRDDPGASLPVYSVPGALDAVLALDRPGLLDTAVDVRAFEPGAPALVGPFEVSTFALPHSVPNVGMRIAADAAVLAYTGDCGPSDDLLRLAEGAEMLLAESSYAIDVPADAARHLSSAAASGLLARHADVGALVLTHLLPETPSELALDAARERFAGPLRVAAPGLTLDIR